MKACWCYGGHSVYQECLTWHRYKMVFVCIFTNGEIGARGVSAKTS